jgi:hypothetical protein
MDENAVEEFKSELQELVGKEGWGVIEGIGTGSVVHFCIRDKVLRSKPMKNPNLTEVVRAYEGEYSLFLLCAWRLDSEKEVVCGCWDDNRKGHKILEGLNLLFGSIITKVIVSQPAFDLSVSFSNHLNLKIFCDQVNESDREDNYHFATPRILYIVGHRSVLSTENTRNAGLSKVAAVA